MVAVPESIRRRAPPTGAEPAGLAFATRLLDALAGVATGNATRCAELGAALRSVGLPAEPGLVRAALLLLLAQGCVTGTLALPDGGLMLTVTGTPLTYWRPAGARRSGDGAGRP
jgi:hypothetical protein